ncbi:hypothetical protein AMK17_28375 [Streptomyces sp. CB00072]|uniref:hypothetical protein n=1 Tax=Streptomyces sp. CB00072 TaxID=1703928 RepID=UPI0009406141|nr:hypothetical protein [Streptomyces sp. CB00072]OKI52262.1 hypothetical protein AMK17_28375 [Streptomyces sp. CB00072]
MSDTNITAARRALLLVFGGIALTVLGSSLAASTGRPVWRVVAVVGCFVQATGWVLYARRTRGGAA